MSFALVAAGALTIGGDVAKGAIGSNASSNAANAQETGEQNGINEENQILGQASSVNQPNLNLGYGADSLLGSLFGIANPTSSATAGGYSAGYNPSSVPGGAGASPSTLPGATGAPGSTTGQGNYSSFYDSPGYQFTLGQGEQAINRGASAGGNLLSTSTLTNLNNYAQGAASTQYNNYVSQLMGLAGLGTSAASNDTQALTNTGSNIASLDTGKGAAQASGVLGSAGALTGAISGGVGALTSPSSANSSGTGGGSALSSILSLL